MNLSAGEKALCAELAARFREEFFSGGPVDICALGDVIKRFWYDGGWQDVGKTHEYPEIASDRAEALAKKFLESGQRPV